MKKNELFPSDAIGLLKRCVCAGQTYLLATSKLIFTCGARPNLAAPGGRDRLMEYAKRHIPDCRFFMAEKFFEVFQNIQKKDLLSLEDQLAEYCDCIIIVLESESAFAELGAFSIKDELAKIILVINDVDHKDSESFIAQGPLAKLDKISAFKPSIFTKPKSILTAATDISARLQKIKKTKNTKLPVKNYEEFCKLKPQLRMFLISDIISLFHPLSHKELIQVFKTLYGENAFDISIDTSLLIALGLIEKPHDYYLQCSCNNEKFFGFYGVNEANARAAIVNHYHKYFRNKAIALKDKAYSKGHV